MRHANSVSELLSGDLTCLVVNHPAAQASVALQGAQILYYIPSGRRPVIWLSEQAAYGTGQSVRGGVPVCWPWFGDLQKNPARIREQYDRSEAPAHGAVRSLLWRLDHVSESADGVTLLLSVPATAMQTALPSLHAHLQLEIFIGKILRLSLTTTAQGESPVAISQALHSYLAVSDIGSVSVSGLENVPFIDTLQDWRIASSNVPVTFSGEVDRIYQGDIGTVRLVDPLWQREIAVQSQHSHSLVLWNPHIEKSKRLSQFSDDAWQRMLCVETANVMDDIVIIQPGEHHVLQVEISVKALNQSAEQ